MSVCVFCLFVCLFVWIGSDEHNHGNPDYSPEITNAIFVANTAKRGAGISGDVYCNPVCNYCKFIDNYSGEKGAGVYLDWGSEVSLNYSYFENNYAYESGGCIAVDGSGTVTLHNGEFSANGGSWEGGCLYAGSHGL